MEVRMIDESTLQRVLFCQIQKNAIDSGSAHYDGYKNWCLSGLEVEKAINDIFSKSGPFAPTIDPETLPIVRELREKLERVTAERDAALKQLSDISDCDTCKHTECIPREGRGKCKWEWNSGAGDNP